MRRLTRNGGGNMMVLTGMTACLISVAVILGSSFAGVLMAFNRLQTTADELALAGARKLNETDRVGQMNNMIARSRQLVYHSRFQQQDAIDKNYTQLNDLADQLLDEARDGAQLLEHERLALRALNKVEAEAAVKAKFDQLKGSHKIVLPWIKVDVPVTPTIRLGYPKNVRSNVLALTGLDELKESDEDAGYVDAASKLNKENINAKLPGSDGDLTFKLSCLPAPVDGTVAPARIALADVFQSLPSNHLQSVVQVELRLNVDTMLGAGSGHGEMKCTGTAVATGGALQP